MSVPHPLIQVADAVVAELASGLSLSAFRHLRPIFRMGDNGPEPLSDEFRLADQNVVVIPREQTRTRLTRDSWQFDRRVWVQVAQRVASQEEADSLSTVVGEIEAFLAQRALGDFADVKPMEVVLETLYVPEHYEEASVYLAVLSLTYQTYEEIA